MCRTTAISQDRPAPREAPCIKAVRYTSVALAALALVATTFSVLIYKGVLWHNPFKNALAPIVMGSSAALFSLIALSTGCRSSKRVEETVPLQQMLIRPLNGNEHATTTHLQYTSSHGTYSVRESLRDGEAFIYRDRLLVCEDGVCTEYVVTQDGPPPWPLVNSLDLVNDREYSPDFIRSKLPDGLYATHCTQTALLGNDHLAITGQLSTNEALPRTIFYVLQRGLEPRYFMLPHTPPDVYRLPNTIFDALSEQDDLYVSDADRVFYLHNDQIQELEVDVSRVPAVNIHSDIEYAVYKFPDRDLYAFRQGTHMGIFLEDDLRVAVHTHVGGYFGTHNIPPAEELMVTTIPTETRDLSALQGLLGENQALYYDENTIVCTIDGELVERTIVFNGTPPWVMMNTPDSSPGEFHLDYIRNHTAMPVGNHEELTHQLGVGVISTAVVVIEGRRIYVKLEGGQSPRYLYTRPNYSAAIIPLPTMTNLGPNQYWVNENGCIFTRDRNDKVITVPQESFKTGYPAPALGGKPQKIALTSRKWNARRYNGSTIAVFDGDQKIRCIIFPCDDTGLVGLNRFNGDDDSVDYFNADDQEAKIREYLSTFVTPAAELDHFVNRCLV